MKFRVVIFLFLVFVGGDLTVLYSQSLKDKIDQAAQEFVNQEQNRNAAVSLTVLNAASGNEIYSLNGTLGLPTASTLKVVTAATAYYKLGKNFRFKTQLLYDGVIRDNTLYGDIIIRGSGDPSLGSDRYPEADAKTVLSKWVQVIKERGIQHIKGRIIGDASAFDTQTAPAGWTWEDLGNYYGAGVSGLNWRENKYDLLLKPGGVKGEGVQITGTKPDVDQLEFINELKTGSEDSGDQVYIYAAPYGNQAFVRGTAPANHADFKVSGSVPDPALQLAVELRQALRQANITVSEAATTSRLTRVLLQSSEQKLLTIHQSPALKEINHWFLTKSINLYGESLLKTIALKENDRPDTEKGITAVKEFWETKGIDPAALNIKDGSGLSPSNRVTTQTLARVLYHVSKENWYADFYDNLPVIHQIKMKSGYIEGVVAYSGFMTAKDGTPLVFSFIVNNYSKGAETVRPAVFRLLDKIKN